MPVEPLISAFTMTRRVLCMFPLCLALYLSLVPAPVPGPVLAASAVESMVVVAPDELM